MKRLACLLSTLTCALVISGRAQDVADAIPGLRPELAFRFTLPADLKEGSISTSEGTLRSPVFKKDFGAWRYVSGVSYQITSLQVSGADVRGFTGHAISLPQDLFWLPNGRNPGWFGWLRVAPGVASDLHSVGARDLSLATLAALGYRTGPHWTFMAGAYFSRDVGAPRTLPAIGLIWSPCSQWTVALVPPRFLVKWRPDDQWAFKFLVQPDGGSWHESTQQGRIYELRQFSAGLEAERKISAHAAVFAGVGYSFGGKLEVREDGGDGLYSSDIRPGPQVSTGLKISF
jgi:hypothetical protein